MIPIAKTTKARNQGQNQRTDVSTSNDQPVSDEIKRAAQRIGYGEAAASWIVPVSLETVNELSSCTDDVHTRLLMALNAFEHLRQEGNAGMDLHHALLNGGKLQDNPEGWTEIERYYAEAHRNLMLVVDSTTHVDRELMQLHRSKAVSPLSEKFMLVDFSPLGGEL